MTLLYRILFSLSFVLSLKAMEPSAPCKLTFIKQEVKDIPELMQHIMSYLDGNNRALNYLIRIYGLSKEIAKKVIEKFLDQIPLYPTSIKAIDTILQLYFKTTSEDTQKQLRAALFTYSERHPLCTLFYQKNFKLLEEMLAMSTYWLEKKDLTRYRRGHDYNTLIRSGSHKSVITIYPLLFSRRGFDLSSLDNLLDLKSELTLTIQEFKKCTIALNLRGNAYVVKTLYCTLPHLLLPFILATIALTCFYHFDKVPFKYLLLFAAVCGLGKNLYALHKAQDRICPHLKFKFPAITLSFAFIALIFNLICWNPVTFESSLQALPDLLLLTITLDWLLYRTRNSYLKALFDQLETNTRYFYLHGLFKHLLNEFEEVLLTVEKRLQKQI